MNKISRFVFNFRSHCNMHCPYCYIPFRDKTPGNLSLWKAILDKISWYSPDMVTFGGGDPFAYQDFIELLQYCKTYPFQIQVDTNTIGMPLDRMQEIGELVDIIGVPLDGSREQHDQIRAYAGHYDRVSRSLDELEKFHIPAKINTVYFPRQDRQLVNIADKIRTYSHIKQWFIYEYWHIKDINEDSKCGSEALGDEEIRWLQQRSAVPKVHYSSVKERSPAYLFVSSLGNLYTIGRQTDQYIELGNILDDHADAVLAALQNGEQILARTRLKQVTQ